MSQPSSVASTYLEGIHIHPDLAHYSLGYCFLPAYSTQSQSQRNVLLLESRNTFLSSVSTWIYPTLQFLTLFLLSTFLEYNWMVPCKVARSRIQGGPKHRRDTNGERFEGQGHAAAANYPGFLSRSYTVEREFICQWAALEEQSSEDGKEVTRMLQSQINGFSCNSFWNQCKGDKSQVERKR